MAISVEARTEIIALVVGMFDAAPGASVLSGLVASYESGATIPQIAASLANTAEFKSIYPTFLTNDEYATKVVANLLGEATATAKAEAVVVLTAALNGGMTRSVAMTEAIKFVANTATTDTAFGTSAAAFDNKVAVATYFSVDTQQSGDSLQDLQDVIVNVTSTAASVVAAKAVIDGTSNEGSTFNFTTAADTFVGTSLDDNFVAGPGIVINPAGGAQVVIDTLQASDVITGGAGNDTLSVRVSTATAIVPVMTGVENVKATFNAVGSLSLANSTGVTAVTVDGSTTAGTVTSIGGATLAVANQTQNVNLNGSTATALNLNFNAVGKSTALITLDLASATANAATSFAITAKDAYVTLAQTTGSAATTSASIAATGTNKISFAAEDLASITTVTTTGAGSVDLTGAAMTALKTLTAGDGGTKVDATGGVLETVTAGSGKDTVTVVGATAKSISTGAGDDTVNQVTTALAATATIDLGAGDDTVNFGTTFATGATVTGGEGKDTIGFAKANYTTISGYTSTNLAKVTGFEVLSITDALATGDSIDVSKLTGITSFKAAAGITTANSATVTNLGAATSVELAGAAANNGTLTASLKTDTTADAMTLVLNKNFADNNDATVDDTAVAATVVVATVESLTVNSTAKQTAVFAPITGYKTDTVTNTLTLTGSDALTDITVTGNQKLVLASTAAMTKLATIDGSASTGSISFNGSAAVAGGVAMTIKGSATAGNTLVGSLKADTIVGGATVDTITGGKGGDTLTGNGGNDKFVFAAGDSAIGTGTFDTITDFAGNTWGNGTGGAAGTEADLTVASKVTGDVLSFTVSGTAAAANGIKVFVASSAADATTFLANTASGDSTQASAALDSTTNKLYVDISGDGVTDFYISLTGVSTLTAAAFDIN